MDCSNAYQGTLWEGNEAVRMVFRTQAKTPKGISVMTNGHQIDLNKVDTIADEVAKCLGVQVKYCGLRVLVVKDFETRGGLQVFTYGSGVYYGALQSPGTAVTTPDLHSLAHEFGHLLTGEIGHGPKQLLCSP